MSVKVSRRYLLRFSYLGSNFCGIQRQTKRHPGVPDFNSVQGVLERALFKSLHLAQEACLVISSRTDKGVHAIDTTAHVDLYRGSEDRGFDESKILTSVNNYFRKNEHAIILRRAIHVPYWFHSRYCAKRRSYTYRLGIAKDLSGVEVNLNVPLLEYNLCFFMASGLNIELVHQACDLMSGYHDFRTFQNVSPVDKPTQKYIDEFTFTPCHSAPSLAGYQQFNYWNFNITARSFLYRQVRRMVGAALAVGYGKIDLCKLEQMLSTPDRMSWDRRIFIVPPHGLYLMNVFYDPPDFELDAKPPAWSPTEPFIGQYSVVKQLDSSIKDDVKEEICSN